MNDRKHSPKTRANGTGTARKRGKTWTSVAVVDWKEAPDGSHKIPIYKTKGGFSRKSDALNYCETLRQEYKLNHGLRTTPVYPTLSQIYEEWKERHSARIVKSTMLCYTAAWKHYASLSNVRMDQITMQDLQDCMDACPAGKRTHQNMKVLAGLLWKYAVSLRRVPQDITGTLYIGKHDTVQRDPLTESEVESVRGSIGKIRYAEYVYASCYLGFRPTEFLSIRKDHYRVIDGFECIVNGMKTEAGKNRVVVIPTQILDIVRERLYVPGTDLIFPRYDTNRKKQFTGFSQMSEAYFRESVFKPMMASLGIAEGKTPYAARHTFSDKLKRAEGDEKAKAGLMGHTNYSFTKSHYQSTDITDLVEVAASIE